MVMDGRNIDDHLRRGAAARIGRQPGRQLVRAGTLRMKNLLAFLSVWLALPLAAQTVNPNQIRPATVDGQVLTTPIANQAPSWQTPASGVSIATTPPCTVNGGTGPVSSGTATITCANGTQTYYKQQGTGTYFQLIRPTGCVATHTSSFSAECVGNNAGSIFTRRNRGGDSYLFVYRSHTPSRSDTRWRVCLRNFFCNRQHECG